MNKLNKLTMITALLMLATLYGSAQRITVTVAGGIGTGYSGDGVPAKLTSITPSDVCMDAAGNIYIAEHDTYRIRKVNAANGMITTVAGGGTSSADGIAATTALIEPYYLYIDAAGNIYFTENFSNRIRKIDAATGLIYTVGGNGTTGYIGDGGPATAAALQGLQGICLDGAGNVFFVDYVNQRVRKIAAATGIITTVAGNGATGHTGDGGPATAAELYFPMTIGADAAGNIYFSDQNGAYIREINAATGIICAIAGNGSSPDADGGPATATGLGNVDGLHVDGAGDLFLNDISCGSTKIDMLAGTINRTAGNLSMSGYNGDGLNSLLELFDSPGGLWVDPSNNIYIADYGDSRVRKVIWLTHTPTFAYGPGQTIEICSGVSSYPLDTLLSITDMDLGQPEYWTVATPPVHGSLSGFPASAASFGDSSVTMPAAVSYIPPAMLSGTDSFRIMVSDGMLSNVITVYVVSGDLTPATIAAPPGICVGTGVTISDAYTGGTWALSNTSIAWINPDLGHLSALTPGVDTIIYTANAMCGLETARRPILISSAPPDSAGTITGPAILCVGTTNTFASTAAYGVWTLSNPTEASISALGVAAGIAAGTDTVIYTINNGCGIAATSAVLTIAPQPNAGYINTDEVLCIGNHMQLFDAATGGIWSMSNSLASISDSGVITGRLAGIDTAMYTVTNACGSATASRAVYVADCNPAGIAPTPQAAGITVYPNPAASVITVSWQGMNCSAINITDVSGRTVATAAAATATGSRAIDISALSSGIYYIMITGDEGTAVQKFVKM